MLLGIWFLVRITKVWHCTLSIIIPEIWWDKSWYLFFFSHSNKSKKFFCYNDSFKCIDRVFPLYKRFSLFRFVWVCDLRSIHKMSVNRFDTWDLDWVCQFRMNPMMRMNYLSFRSRCFSVSMQAYVLFAGFALGPLALQERYTSI